MVSGKLRESNRNMRNVGPGGPTTPHFTVHILNDRFTIHYLPWHIGHVFSLLRAIESKKEKSFELIILKRVHLTTYTFIT